MLNNIIKKIKELNDIKLIKNSVFFDKHYYRKQVPNLKGSSVKHYYYKGFKEGKSPNYNFSNDYYLNKYKDVKSAQINPLIHYLKNGKFEGRMISEENGLSLDELYYSINNYFYRINIYISSNEKQKVNLFFDNEDKDLSQYDHLILKLLDYCKENNYILRIIYSNVNLDIFKKLHSYNFILKAGIVEILHLKKSNYVFANENDIFIATSYRIVNALMNSKTFNSNIYFYVYKDIKTVKEKYYFSKFNESSQIVYFSDADINIKKNNLNLKHDGYLSHKIYYNSKDLFFEGVELFDNYLLHNNNPNIVK